MNNLNIKAITDSTKEELDQLAGILIDASEGYEMESYIFAKKLEYLSKVLVECMHDRAKDEAERNKNTIVKSAEISIKEVGVKYDYSKCNYTPYNAILEKKKAIESEQKTMESLLKAISKPQTIVDDATGEVMEVKPPQKTSKTSIIISLK